MKPYRRANKVFMVQVRGPDELFTSTLPPKVLHLKHYTSPYIKTSQLLKVVWNPSNKDSLGNCHDYGAVCKSFGRQQLRSASGLGRLRVLAREFASDVQSLWRYGAPFPTFLKLIGTLFLCLLVVMPLIYPLFVVAMTYFTYEGLYLSWHLDQPWRFTPVSILRRAIAVSSHRCNSHDVWKVREVLTRGILLAHSLATSVDYLCVMQGLLDET